MKTLWATYVIASFAFLALSTLELSRHSNVPEGWLWVGGVWVNSWAAAASLKKLMEKA